MNPSKILSDADSLGSGSPFNPIDISDPANLEPANTRCGGVGSEEVVPEKLPPLHHFAAT